MDGLLSECGCAARLRQGFGAASAGSLRQAHHAIKHADVRDEAPGNIRACTPISGCEDHNDDLPALDLSFRVVRACRRLDIDVSRHVGGTCVHDAGWDWTSAAVNPHTINVPHTAIFSGSQFVQRGKKLAIMLSGRPRRPLCVANLKANQT